MNTIENIPGLAGQIADFICSETYMTCPAFALGGAIATLSALSKARYVITYPEIDDDLHTVYQGVSVDGPAACGKTSTIQVVEQLVHSAGAACASGWNGTKSGLWQFGSENPGGLLVFDYFGHHSLLSAGDRKSMEVITELLESAHKDVAARPFYSRNATSKAYLPPSPVTILTKARDWAKEKKLPIDDVFSHFFGLLLHVPYDGNRIVNSKTTTVDADGLIASLKALYELPQNQSVEVRWSAEARVVFHEFASIFKSVERNLWKQRGQLMMPPQVVSEIKVASIAALIAVGCNSENPIIALEHLEIALELMDADWYSVRAGLDVEPLAMDDAH